MLIIDDEINGEEMKKIVLKKIRGKLKVVEVKEKGFGESRKDKLEEIEVMNGGKVI